MIRWIVIAFVTGVIAGGLCALLCKMPPGVAYILLIGFSPGFVAGALYVLLVSKLWQ